MVGTMDKFQLEPQTAARPLLQAMAKKSFRQVLHEWRTLVEQKKLGALDRGQFSLLLRFIRPKIQYPQSHVRGIEYMRAIALLNDIFSVKAQMEELRMPLLPHDWHHVLLMAAQCHQMHRMEWVWDEMSTLQVPKNVRMWNAYMLGKMNGLSAKGMMAEENERNTRAADAALQVLERIRADGVEPDYHSMALCLFAQAKAGRMGEVDRIIKETWNIPHDESRPLCDPTSRFYPTHSTLLHMVNAYGINGEIEKMVVVLETAMRVYNLPPIPRDVSDALLRWTIFAAKSKRVAQTAPMELCKILLAKPYRVRPSILMLAMQTSYLVAIRDINGAKDCLNRMCLLYPWEKVQRQVEKYVNQILEGLLQTQRYSDVVYFANKWKDRVELNMRKVERARKRIAEGRTPDRSVVPLGRGVRPVEHQEELPVLPVLNPL